MIIRAYFAIAVPSIFWATIALKDEWNKRDLAPVINKDVPSMVDAEEEDEDKGCIDFCSFRRRLAKLSIRSDPLVRVLIYWPPFSLCMIRNPTTFLNFSRVFAKNADQISNFLRGMAAAGCPSREGIFAPSTTQNSSKVLTYHILSRVNKQNTKKETYNKIVRVHRCLQMDRHGQNWP